MFRWEGEREKGKKRLLFPSEKEKEVSQAVKSSTKWSFPSSERLRYELGMFQPWDCELYKHNLMLMVLGCKRESDTQGWETNLIAASLLLCLFKNACSALARSHQKTRWKRRECEQKDRFFEAVGPHEKVCVCGVGAPAPPSWFI